MAQTGPLTRFVGNRRRRNLAARHGPLNGLCGKLARLKRFDAATQTGPAHFLVSIFGFDWSGEIQKLSGILERFEVLKFGAVYQLLESFVRFQVWFWISDC